MFFPTLYRPFFVSELKKTVCFPLYKPPPKNLFLSFHYLIFVLPFCPSNSPSFFNNHIFRLSSPPLPFYPLYRFELRTKWHKSKIVFPNKYLKTSPISHQNPLGKILPMRHKKGRTAKPYSPRIKVSIKNPPTLPLHN